MTSENLPDAPESNKDNSRLNKEFSGFSYGIRPGCIGCRILRKMGCINLDCPSQASAVRIDALKNRDWGESIKNNHR